MLWRMFFVWGVMAKRAVYWLIFLAEAIRIFILASNIMLRAALSPARFKPDIYLIANQPEALL